MQTRFSLQSQIAEVEREIRQRRNVYPRLVSKREISDERAELQISLMQSVLDTLTWLHRHEAVVRAAVSPSKGGA